ncbi:MAG: histidinol-phosphate transaminase [Desulfurivibrionaceae bacterium]|nr:histidinol-phosphate transaminase [Desulfobulbales bacterium]MDT8335387.1 histidinol-phosphate transaminase [Desulfurivibrionaceae bacterium]
MKLKVPENISSLVPYPPGKPIEELEREYGITGSIKLASNENALGPSPKAMAAIRENLAKLHRYPDGSCYYLAGRLADKLAVKPEQIVFGNGSNEIIELLINTFLASGDEVITSNPTFLVYQKMVQARGGVNRVIPLKKEARKHIAGHGGGSPLGVGHDLAAIPSLINERTRLIFLDNPNNPTGVIFGKDDFEAFLAEVPDEVIVVLDEAYVDFVEPAVRIDVRDYLDQPTPVVGLRTFSKAYGLAGLRIGYGLMNHEIAGYLHRVRQPFNVNLPAQIGALAALDDDEHYRNTLALTRQGIGWLTREIAGLGCTVFDTHTNFFLVDVGLDCRGLYEKMLTKGVIIRPMAAYGYPEYIRITVGLPEENSRLVLSLQESLAELREE